jgi:hypothetical protein
MLLAQGVRKLWRQNVLILMLLGIYLKAICDPIFSALNNT